MFIFFRLFICMSSCSTSNPWKIVNNTFTDFTFEYCKDVRFSYDQTKQASSATERLDWIHRAPDSVDVDLLTDEEIANTCLTIQDCIMPPILTMIRDNKTKELWRPVNSGFKAFADNIIKCCDPSSMFFLPPEGMKGKFFTEATDDSVGITRQTFYPRGASYTNAKIIRIDFSRSTQQLYTYIDITCSAGKNFARRNGFLGQNMARTNGIFQEIVFKGPEGYPNTHTPVNQLMGIASKKSDFGELTSSKKEFDTIFKFIGPFNATTKRYEWVSLWQNWITVSGATVNEMNMVYITAAIDWLKLAPPTGNLPVAFLYFFQAKRIWTTYKKYMNYDRDFLARYFGQMFNAHRDSLDYLFEINSDTKQPRFINDSSDFLECYNALPASFRDGFTKYPNPPEKGCSKFDCPGWTNYAMCPQTMKMLTNAVSKSLYNSVIQTPRCEDCPGLVGNFRETVPSTNKWRSVLQKFPQCLPFRVNETYSIEDPLDLTGVPEPTSLPTHAPTRSPTRSPTYKLNGTDSPTTSPSESNNFIHLYWLLVIPLLLLAYWIRRKRSVVRPTWSLLDQH